MAETIWNTLVEIYDFLMNNLVVINIILALAIIFFQRRSPQTVWTWLLLLYFIPILGFILYLVIGQDFHKSRMFKAKEIEGDLEDFYMEQFDDAEDTVDSFTVSENSGDLGDFRKRGSK